MPLALVVVHEVLPGHEAAFDELAAATLTSVATEPGTVVYALHTSPDHPSRRVFYEVYRDRAAFEQHERYPHVRAFLAEREHHISSVTAEFLEFGPAHGIALP